jgi:hypothetical protein
MTRLSIKHFPQWILIILLVGSAVLFIIPALYNGYPLVYPDTGMYIDSGHSGKVPVMSPLMYGLFVRHISMSASLWFVVVVQAMITVFILMLVARTFWKASWGAKSLLLIICISVFTAASNFTSQIMPDFLTSILILCFCVFLLYDGKSKLLLILPGVLIFFANAAHLSNLLISPLILVIIFIAKFFAGKRFPSFRKLFWLSAIVLLSWIFVPSFNYFKGSGFNLSGTNNIRLMGRLIETGLLSEYLNDNCGKKNIPLCKYRNEFPMSSDYFLWHASPLYDDKPPVRNVDSIWLKKNVEYALVVKDIVSTPKYLLKMAGISITATLKQVGNVGVENLAPMMKGSPVLPQIEWRYPEEASQYKSSRQANAMQTFAVSSAIQILSVLISAIGILFILIFRKFRKSLTNKHILILIITISGIIMNAWVCTTLSTPALRYQSRVSWLIPLVFIILVTHLLNQRKVKQEVISE